MNNKLISFAAAAATLFAMSACNKDANQIDVVTPGTGTYAKVSISMGTPGTRASVGDPDEFDLGTDAERKVNSVMLVVYDAKPDGSIINEVVGYGSTSDFDKTVNNTTAGTVSDEYQKLIELTMMPGKSKANAKYVVAYVNVANELFAFDKAMEETTAAIQEKIQDESYFIMTNAAHGDNASWSVATPIKENSLFSSPEAANAPEAEFTTIYVERLAAKVKVALASSVATEADINIVGVDKKEYKLNFKAAEAVWAPTGTAPKMYKLKNQWTETNLTWANAVATDIKDTRNYWAKGYYYGLINDENPDFTGTLDYVSSNALRREDDKGIGMGTAGYTTEHTYGQDVVDHQDYNALGAATSAIVLGKYEVDGENAGDFKKGDDFDFYLLLNKVSDKEYYTIFNEAQLFQYLIDANKIGTLYTKSGDEYEAITDLTEYLELQWDGASKKYELAFKADDDDDIVIPELYVDQEGNKFDIDELDGTNARHYNLGYAYFFAPIEHLGEKGKVGQYGVVRNHSYELTVKSITSLGAPLDDDHFNTDPEEEGPGDEPIVPDPTEAALIKAELKVLSWHVVTQGVDL